MKLTQSNKENIVKELQSGNITATALAVKYGVSQSAISDQYKKMIGKGLGVRYKLSQIDRKDIVAAIQSEKATMTELDFFPEPKK